MCGVCYCPGRCWLRFSRLIINHNSVLYISCRVTHYQETIKMLLSCEKKWSDTWYSQITQCSTHTLWQRMKGQWDGKENTSDGAWRQRIKGKPCGNNGGQRWRPSHVTVCKDECRQRWGSSTVTCDGRYAYYGRISVVRSVMCDRHTWSVSSAVQDLCHSESTFTSVPRHCRSKSPTIW